MMAGLWDLEVKAGGTPRAQVYRPTLDFLSAETDRESDAWHPPWENSQSVAPESDVYRREAWDIKLWSCVAVNCV